MKGTLGGDATPKKNGQVFAQDEYTQEKMRRSTVGHADPDGFEQVAKWECARDDSGELICPVALMDQGAGTLKSGGSAHSANNGAKTNGKNGYEFGSGLNKSGPHHGGEGGPSRYFASFPGEWGAFYSAKASKRDRTANGNVPNGHPTCKPTALMKYLLTLVTPPNGTVLDCFAGSGSTLVAAAELGIDAIGIEREPEYVEIARRRVEHALEQQEKSPEPTLFEEARH